MLHSSVALLLPRISSSRMQLGKRRSPDSIHVVFQRICLGVLNYFRSIERTLIINTAGLTVVSGHMVPSMEDSSFIKISNGGLGPLHGLETHHYVHRSSAEHKVRSSSGFSSLRAYLLKPFSCSSSCSSFSS